MSSESNNNTLTIKFVRKDGSIQEVRVPEGMTLMEAARKFAEPSIDEIPADCGGCCACGTCHINIREDIDKVGRVEYNSLENELIEYRPEYDRMYSRLACQIQLEKKHDNMKVYLRDYNNV